MEMVVLKLDGEVWLCKEGWDADENSVGGVVAIKPNGVSDRNAMAKGITHRQGNYGGVPCHEIRKLGEVGDGENYGEKLYIWRWQPTGDRGPVGYNSYKGRTKAEALAYGNQMSRLRVDETTLHVGTYEELAKLDREYSSLFN